MDNELQEYIRLNVTLQQITLVSDRDVNNQASYEWDYESGAYAHMTWAFVSILLFYATFRP